MPKRFLGTAAAIKQVRDYTFGGTWVAGETITLTIGNLTLVVTVGATVTTTAVATAVYEAYTNSVTALGTGYSSVPAVTGSGTTGGAQLIPAFTALVATNPSNGVLRLTAATAGVSTTITITTNSAAGTISPGTLTAGTGPNHLDDIDNWDDNDALANSDDLDFGFKSAAVTQALDQSSLQFLTITKAKVFEDDIGLPETATDSSQRPYTEFREKRLKTGHQSIVTTSYLETGEGRGSLLYRHNGTNGQQVWNVYGRRDQRRMDNVPCILLMGTHASNELNNFEGDVGFGFFADEASVLGTFRQGNGSSSRASTIFGAVANLTACSLVVNGGKVVTNSALCTTSGSILLVNGDWTHNAGNVKALTIQGGTFRCLAAAAFSGTISIHGGGKLDLAQGAGTVSFASAIQLYKDAEIDDPNGRLAASTQFVLNGCDWSQVKINLGKGRTLTKAA